MSSIVAGSTGEGPVSHTKVEAVAVGTSGATLLLALCSHLPEGSWWKTVLTLAAPALTVILTAAWLTIRKLVATAIVDRNLKRSVRDAEEALQSAQKSGATEQHLDLLRRDLEKIQLITSERRVRRAKEVRNICSFSWLKDFLK